MVTFSITRALNELKLLDTRINRSINEAKLATIQVGKKLIDGHITPEAYAEAAKASVASITALITRRNEIKSKIVLSNATTPVKFPSGRTMSVAEAIERKGSIIYDKTFLNTLRNQYNGAINSLVRENQNVKVQLERRIENILGKGDALKGKDAEIEQITKSFNAENEAKLIDPIVLKTLIEKLTAEIEEFENEVDFILSESNTRTDIEVAE
ncbi:hypothetical protein MKY96_33350 [Paenibacillus sp. FSL R7-0302]|uniref:hypothetical protein n=1 Tax=Paenibacillus sp. FSL R7-0302 TaxID=2921681 RepID=UPI0030FB53DA